MAVAIEAEAAATEAAAIATNWLKPFRFSPQECSDGLLDTRQVMEITAVGDSGSIKRRYPVANGVRDNLRPCVSCWTRFLFSLSVCPVANININVIHYLIEENRVSAGANR